MTLPYHLPLDRRPSLFLTGVGPAVEEVRLRRGQPGFAYQALRRGILGRQRLVAAGDSAGVRPLRRLWRGMRDNFCEPSVPPPFDSFSSLSCNSRCCGFKLGTRPSSPVARPVPPFKWCVTDVRSLVAGDAGPVTLRSQVRVFRECPRSDDRGECARNPLFPFRCGRVKWADGTPVCGTAHPRGRSVRACDAVHDMSEPGRSDLPRRGGIMLGLCVLPGCGPDWRCLQMLRRGVDLWRPGSPRGCGRQTRGATTRYQHVRVACLSYRVSRDEIKAKARRTP